MIPRQYMAQPDVPMLGEAEVELPLGGCKYISARKAVNL